MAYRRKMRKGRSKRLFRKTAQRTHEKNAPRRIMRGGYRL